MSALTRSLPARLFYLACFFVMPFLIAAAFKFTGWMGWPALLVCGWIWLGAVARIFEGGSR